MQTRVSIFRSSFCRTAGTSSNTSNPKYVNFALNGKENFEKDFKRSHVKTTVFQKLLLGVGSGVVSITSPSRGDMIAVMGEVTGVSAWEYIRSKMMQSEEGRQILEEKPRISSAAVDLEKLKTYPEGTLGKAYSNFLERYGYSPDTRNAVQFVDDFELAYIAQRYREAHDLFHTLLDMPTNMLGEVTVKWVEAIQLKLPMCAAGALFGSVRLAPNFSRTYSTKSVVKLDPVLTEKIENLEINPKKHPGVMHIPCSKVPEVISNNIKSVLGKEDLKTMKENAKKLLNKVECRLVPVERYEIAQKREEYYELLKKKNPKIEEDETLQKIMMNRINKKLLFELYNWKPIDFDRLTSLQYLICRAPAEYAVLKRVFNEIALRDKNFAPKTLFDFGSGVGTVIWAANEFWGTTMEEYYCVDSSRHMNELAALILRNNDIYSEPYIKNVYYRQFFPATPKPYDIVVSAFSFFEIPDCKQRMKTLTRLWNNTEEYLVLIENGTNAGFSLITEARDFILTISKKFEVDCYIFAPCPHEFRCPRLEELGKRTPCNFFVKFEYFKLFEKRFTGTQLFSYLVIRKRKKPQIEDRRCRIVREVLKRHKHVHCRLCTTQGELKHIIASPAKYGKPCYMSMRHSKWGDLLPGKLEILEANIDSEKLISCSSNENFDNGLLEIEKAEDDPGELMSDDSDNESEVENNENVKK